MGVCVDVTDTNRGGGQRTWHSRAFQTTLSRSARLHAVTKGNTPWLGIIVGVALAAVGLGAAYVVAFVVPPLVVDAEGLDRARQLELENNVRGTLLGSLAGVLFLVTAFFTYRQVRVAQQRLDVERQGHVTERFTRAIEQLGHETVDVRLGGLFSLERLAVDEPRRYAANVYEILVAYLREHSRPEQYDISDNEKFSVENHDQAPPHIGTDLETVLTVLGRQRRLFDKHVEHLPDGGGEGPHLVDVDLSGRWLRGASFDKATVTDCGFGGAILTDCRFGGATITGCRFDGATLTGCRFFGGTTLTGCRFFDGATLTDCEFWDGATLTDCRFDGTTLTDCEFFDGATLTDCLFFGGTTLTDCRFHRTTLTGCDFEDATFARTPFEQVEWRPEKPPTWPPKFQAPTNNWSEGGDSDDR